MPTPDRPALRKWGRWGHNRATRPPARQERPTPRKPAKKVAARSPQLPAAALAALRHAALCAYTSDAHDGTVVELAEQEQFAGVGLPRLRRWAAEDGWEAGRQRVRDQWRQQAKQQLVRGLLRRHERQMQMLGHLHDEAVRLRHQPSVQPRSWESVANVQLKAAQMMREWSKDTHEAVAALVGATAQRQSGETQSTGAGLDLGDVGDMDDDDARLGAHAILRQRMKRRLRPPSELGDDVDAAPPVAPPVPLRAAGGQV